MAVTETMSERHSFSTTETITEDITILFFVIIYKVTFWQIISNLHQVTVERMTSSINTRLKLKEIIWQNKHACCQCFEERGDLSLRALE